MKEKVSIAEPSASHYLFAYLMKIGKVLAWYTQNIDCLEDKAGITEESGHLVKLHGSLSQFRGISCNHIVSWTSELTGILKQGKLPPCSVCSLIPVSTKVRRKQRPGFLRPDVVLYHEQHPNGFRIAKHFNRITSSHPDLVVVVGTSLSLPSLNAWLKGISFLVRETGGHVIFVNLDPPPVALKEIFTHFIQEECDKVFGPILEKLTSQVVVSIDKKPRTSNIKRRRSIFNKDDSLWSIFIVVAILGRNLLRFNSQRIN